MIIISTTIIVNFDKVQAIELDIYTTMAVQFMSRVLILYFSNFNRYSHQKFTDALTLLVEQ